MQKHTRREKAGGVRYEVDIVNYFRQKGHTYDVVTVAEENKYSCEKEIGGEIIRLPQHLEITTARVSLQMPRFLFDRFEQYDLIHFNAPNPIGELSYLITRSFKGKNVKTVCSYHGEVVSAKPLYKLYNSWLLKTHLNACDKIIASSPRIVQTTTLLSEYIDKVEIIPYGIDTDFFRPNPC